MKYQVVDEPLPSLGSQKTPPQNADFGDVHSAIAEAYRRSFIHDCVPIAVYDPQGEFVGRCLDGKWAGASEFR